MHTTYFGSDAVSANDYRFKLLMALEEANWEIVAGRKHDKATHPDFDQTLIIPRHLADRHLANNILKTAQIDMRL